jgi:asparagine synthase (glutamine-hydrolysing)
MCGIWLCLTNKVLTHTELDVMHTNANRLVNRGPDNTKEINIKIDNLHIYLKFFRLSIRDVSHAGDQPFILNLPDKTIYLMCNGEIYNYEYLVQKYNLQDKLTSHSDCEVLIHLYNLLGMKGLYDELCEGDDVSGEFAMIVLEVPVVLEVSVVLEESKITKTVKVSVCRDPAGVRPLYEAYWYNNNTNERMIQFSSELKGLSLYESDDFVKGEQYKPYHYTTYTFDTNTSDILNIENEQRSFKYIKNEEGELIERPFTIFDEKEACHKINKIFTKCVSQRMSSDRPIIFACSGGVDSSLSAAKGAIYNISNDLPPIKTICVGMEGGTDEPYAKAVAKHIGSDHIHVLCSEDEFLKKVEETIYTIESFDITTVRASIGQLIASQKIAQLTNSKVVIIGDYSDEITGGYKETGFAPTTQDFSDRCFELVDEIYMYDAQRADRCISSCKLEARCPFGDHRFIKLYFSIDPELRKPHNGVEKYLLRKSNDKQGLLPDEVLWRQKEAFSDGVSSLKKSWYQILQESIDKMYTDEEFEERRKKYTHMQPYTKESLYYREVFCKFYSDKLSNVIPHYWLPKWGQSKDPSARTLSNYVKSE